MISLRFNFRLLSKDNEKIRNRQGRYFLTDKFKLFERAIKIEAKKQYKGKMLKGNLGEEVRVYYTNKVHPDTTNLFKSLNDALQEICYKNDRQIKKASIELCEKAEKDWFEVEIYELKGGGLNGLH